MEKKDTSGQEVAGQNTIISNQILTGLGHGQEKGQLDETDDFEITFEQLKSPFEQLVDEEESDGSASAFEGTEIPREEDFRELSDKDLDDIIGD